MGNNQSRSSTANEEPRTPSFQQDSASLAQLFARNPENSDRDVDSLEQRRNAKLEREARRAEREKVARENERDRSMKEESIDGGYLVTQGVYTGAEDFSKPVVRQLMIERKLAPFWRGLQDFSPSWTEYQLVAVARGKPLPAADDIPEEEPEPVNPGETKIVVGQALHNSNTPTSSRAFSTGSDRKYDEELGSKVKIVGSDSSSDLNYREIRLPHEPNYKGQPIEAYLYKDATECPICFLYYPNWQNKTRCCLQDICSECFVQVARKAPHLPEGEQSQNEADSSKDAQLISTPACCPYCSTPDMGVFYTPPPFSRGLAYADSKTGTAASPPQQIQRGRATSLAVNNERVVSTDRIRPDFENVLLKENLVRSRRNAAATALHTAAYLMNGRGSDSRLFGRRNVLRRGGPESPGASSSHLGMLAMMAERYEAANQEIAEAEANSPSILGPPRQSSRRNRMEDLEDMMMMEAIRLSLAAEQERQQREQKQEEKNKKKAEKQKAKEEKKAEKAAKKSGLYLSATNSSGQINDSEGKGKETARPNDPFGRAASPESPQSYLERSRAQILINDSPQSSTFPPTPFRSSHLRNVSGVSSSASSFVDTSRRHAGSVSSLDASPNASGTHLPEQISGTPPGGGAGLEPMFNFRSLAAMIDNEDKRAASPLVEHSEHTDGLLLDSSSGPQDTSDSAQAYTPPETIPSQASGQPTVSEDHPLASKELNISRETLDKETSKAV